MRWWFFWSALLFIVAWWDRQSSNVRWRIHRPVQRLERTVEIKPIIFQNASILWMNALSDEIDLTLIDVSNPHIGTVDIERLEMRVYDDPQRTHVAEIYEVDYDMLEDGLWNYTFLQNDVHLSPFRRLFVFPKIDWNLGHGGCDWCFPRTGYYQNGWWVEPRAWRWAPWVSIWAIGLVTSHMKCCTHKGRRVRVRY